MRVSFSLTLCTFKHRKGICTYLSSYLPRLDTFKQKLVHRLCTFKQKFAHTLCTFKVYQKSSPSQLVTFFLIFILFFLHLVSSSMSRPPLYFWRSFGSCHEQRPPLAAVPLSFSRAPGAPTCLYSCPSPPHLSTPIFQPACPILGNLLTPTPACGLFGPRLCSVSGL